jgi:L-lactate dehydrogenase
MRSKPSKAGIVGAGHVGAELAYALVLLRSCDQVILFDRTLSKAQAQAWDIEDTIPLLSEMDLLPSDQYEELADCDVIAVTVGTPADKGEDRLALLGRNVDIIRSVIEELDRVAPNAIIIVVSNPVDVLTRIAIETSSRPENLILGSGTVLDTARLKYQLGKKLNVSKQDIYVYVIGEHGNSEFIAWSSASVGLVGLAEFLILGETTLENIKEDYVEFTRQRGYSISDRKGYTSYGIATVITQLIKAILRDEKQIFTVSVKADAKYDIGNKVVLGLPCIIGEQGIERKLVLPRNREEQRALLASATKLNEAYNSLLVRGEQVSMTSES